MDKKDELNYYNIVFELLERQHNNLKNSIKEMTKRKDIDIDTYEKYLSDADIIGKALKQTKDILKGLS